MFSSLVNYVLSFSTAMNQCFKNIWENLTSRPTSTKFYTKN